MFVILVIAHKKDISLLKVFNIRETKGTRMKIAVSGKGGVGKTTFSALLIRMLSDAGKKVLAIDADPDANLAAAIGIENSDRITPIAEMKDMIFERTGAKAGTIGGFFKLNPKVDDLPDTLSVKKDNIKLMRLGSVKKGGGGCLCPESTLLKSLVMHIVLLRDEVVVMDMEAGIEHLGRATASAVDKLIVVVEPGRRSIDTAAHIRRLAEEIHLTRIAVVGNKIRSPQDEAFIREHLADFDILGFLPYGNELIEADLKGQSPYDVASEAKRRIQEMVEKL
ncbi:nucleotide-binding protein [Desulfatitalea tepidiphila]|uniref:ATP-binding protein n=1 Tax=Desulfatitalea tepidiphila TaxID=1185843 RepID=UPI000975F6A2|nr:carbon monoxide dehydrogenase accessory protein CooC [Desulfatitalea tepidiphila]